MLLKTAKPDDSIGRKAITAACAPAVLALFLGAFASAAAAGQPCVLELPVYGPKGDRLPFRVVEVRAEGGRGPNILSLKLKEMWAKEERLYFTERALLGRVLEVTLEDARGGRISESIFLTQCTQRASLRYGSSEAYGDVYANVIRGRLTGCRFDRDWWVRAFPMFGAVAPIAALEGYVFPDGSFELSGQMEGERHIVVFGKGKQPVRAIGVDVTNAQVANAGEIDLRGACPK